MSPLPPHTNKARLLVIRSSSIGDVVLATAAITRSRDWEKWHGIELDLHWAGQEPSLSLIREFLPGVTTHDIHQPGSLPPDLDGCLDLQGNLRSIRLGWWLRLKTGSKVVRSGKNYLYRTALIARSRLFGRSQPSLGMEKLACLAGGAARKRQCDEAADAMTRLLSRIFPDIKPSEDQTRTLLSCSSQSPALDPAIRWLAVAPGAAHPAKKAPTQLFADTLLELSLRLGERDAKITGIVLLGTATEKADCATLRQMLQGISGSSGKGWVGPVIDLSGQTNLQGTVPLIHSCTAILSNDSSLGHIAESLGKPAFVFFGPTVEAFGFAPYLKQSRSYSVAIGCRPCSKHGKADCRYGDQRCFTSITHQQVAQDLAAWITGSGS